MNIPRPFRKENDPVIVTQMKKNLRVAMSISIIVFMIFLPVAVMSFLTIFGVIEPSFNQWFAVFVLFALGVFLDWLI